MPEHRAVQRYGWKPSLPDPRDLLADTATLTVKPEVDPRKQMPKVYDQGPLGSCTANAIAAAIEYDRSLADYVGARWTPSRLDIYYGERSIEGTVDQDSGAFGRDGFKYAHKTGVIPEADWPYDISRFTQKPDAEPGKRFKIGAYAAVPRSVIQMKRVLSNRQTVAFGFSVFESFEDGDMARTGVMSYPNQSEKMLGGHEVLMVGYLKNHPDFALCRNSWSATWGLRGYFLMPWAIILDPSLSGDFRTIKRAAGA